MQNVYTKNLYNVKHSASQQVAIRIGLIILLIFAVLRPITLMVGSIGISGTNMLEIFGIGISYFFLIPLTAGFRQIKFDRTFFISIIFCLYCVDSILWGSKIREIAITILPFLLYFSVRAFITELKELKILIISIYFSFIIPIALSTYNIIADRNITVVEFWNQLPRNAGAFSGPHTLAYTMLLVSFFFCILNYLYQFKNVITRLIIYFFLILSFYCLYQSHTRTAIIGFIIFWLIYLLRNNRLLFYCAIVLSIIIGILFQSNIQSLIWKTPAEHDIDRATSGRTIMFKNNVRFFIDSSLLKKIIGNGISDESRYGYHNDFMRLLISYGLIGLSLYFALLFYILWDIFLFEDYKTKYLFAAVLISVAAMNFGSNGYVFRIELSQYFWIMVGLFYNIREIKIGKYDTIKNKIGNS